MPDDPGPPGLTSSEPIRWAWSSAGRRSRARLMVPADRSVQSSGAVTVAHSKSPQVLQVTSWP